MSVMTSSSLSANQRVATPQPSFSVLGRPQKTNVVWFCFLQWKYHHKNTIILFLIFNFIFFFILLILFPAFSICPFRSAATNFLLSLRLFWQYYASFYHFFVCLDFSLRKVSPGSLTSCCSWRNSPCLQSDGGGWNGFAWVVLCVFFFFFFTNETVR